MSTEGEIFNLYSDGASRGNPGDAGVGVIIYDGAGDMVVTAKRYLGTCTNNEAEYRALILGLEEALKRGMRTLNIFLDSELLVRQINGQYRVKNSNLQVLMQEVRKLLSFLDTYSVEHVRREKNTAADRLANEAIDEALKGGKVL
ncbi:MAG: ribonuclease HI family protein [Deltaproteobacteria bacterium]|nr:ribonuclease HI family protein [Deltaproteobacteria bacterium]